MKTSRFLLAAGISLALALTFSCSGDGGGNSNSGWNNLIKKDKISGFSQKGPFVKGSTATLYELDDKFTQTGRSFRDIIADDRGSFEIKNVELVSPYAMLEADGYYRNEVTGEISKGPIKLYAIADIREKDNVNVNLLTHLEYYRAQKLVEGGVSLKEAKKQAQKEILAIFGINGDFENSEDMSIFGTSEGDAVLLAISILLQGDLSEGQFTERLTDFSLGFRESGVWNNEAVKDAMADWAAWANLESIRNKILGWGLSSAVPDFEKFVRDYWYANYDLEICNSDLQGNIKKNPKDVYYICKNNAWVIATEYEQDIYQWVCSTEGEVKDGQVSGIKYVCKYNNWQIARYVDIKCFESNSCLIFTDTRNNKSYASVVIGTQVWMAENLNYNAEGSLCYNNLESNCDKYGRLYDWEAAIEVCPDGWHLPTYAEWDELVIAIGGYDTSGKYLKATEGWEMDNSNGTDDFGFAALPGGYEYYESWCVATTVTEYAYYSLMKPHIRLEPYSKTGFSAAVRCLQNN
ncbi:MAG: fibrobacter succinogenes major paralogous domain-containing protein [Fibromonadaceae bacterium]|jgi:uncharacterized protein (TIGR02145 family)|nr:fibrobacter succinogenes major paralogous domain-containing protein [Fibromonadaceae bacterium]